MNNETKPTEAAMQAAMQIIHGPGGLAFTCLKDLPLPTAESLARLIDTHTQLPEKHVALFAAQQVVDAMEKKDYAPLPLQLIDELRDALKEIKAQGLTPSRESPSSSCGQKDYKAKTSSDRAQQPPQAGGAQENPPL